MRLSGRTVWGSLGALLLALVMAGPGTAAAPKLSIPPIQAIFLPTKLATSYTVAPIGEAPKGLTYKWTLQLTLVDPAGAPSSAESDAHAAVDPTCDNTELPGGKAAGGETFVWDNLGGSFIWYHGDKGAYPDGYGCNHKAMGPSGHEGLVTVVVTGGGWTCTASIKGTNLTPVPLNGETPHCVEVTPAVVPPVATTTVPATTTTATPTTTAVATSSSSGGGGFPIWIPIVGVLVLLGAGGIWFVLSRGSADDCSELRARCLQLQADAAAVAQAAAAADAKAASAQADLQKATAARQSAQQAATAADHPEEGSWMEDADTGERVTEHDLTLQRQDPTGAWADPARRAELRAQEKAQAHAALDAATSAEATAKAASDAATAAAKQADEAAANARAAAAAACKAADDCELAAAAAKQAADEAARHEAEEVAEQKAADEAKQRAEAAKEAREHEEVERAAAAAAAAAAVTRRRHEAEEAERRRTECPDGSEPRVESNSEEFQLWLTWAGTITIGADMLLMTRDDVEAALEGFEKFKAVTDIAEFGEGFVTETGVVALTSADAILNVITTGTDQIFGAVDQPNLTDPSSAAEWGVMKGLEKLIDIFDKRRATYGEWEMTCPLVPVKATCTKTYECIEGHWTLTTHQFIVEYGKKIRDGSFALYANHERPVDFTRKQLYDHFAQQNKLPLKRLAEMAKACAASK